MIAITGLIGCGKSLVASVVREAGFEVLDTDALAHCLYKTNTDLRKKIAKEFGEEALDENGINRKYMANLVFETIEKLELLESIVHPILQKEIEKINPPYAEAAVLHKLPELAKKMQEIWIVEASESIRRERLLRKGMQEADIENRMRAQMQQPACWQLAKKTIKIDNNGTREACIAFAKCLIEKL